MSYLNTADSSDPEILMEALMRRFTISHYGKHRMHLRKWGKDCFRLWLYWPRKELFLNSTEVRGWLVNYWWSYPIYGYDRRIDTKDTSLYPGFNNPLYGPHLHRRADPKPW